MEGGELRGTYIYRLYAYMLQAIGHTGSFPCSAHQSRSLPLVPEAVPAVPTSGMLLPCTPVAVLYQ